MIYFQEQEAAATAFNRLNSKTGIQALKDEPPWCMEAEAVGDKLAKMMAETTRTLLERRKLLHIIQHQFLFNEEEANVIASVAQSLISGEIEGIPEVHQLPELGVHVYDAWRKFLSNPPQEFYFEAVIMFRLKQYDTILRSYAECAIDEYKMELEYQMFIDHIRRCVERQRTYEKHVTVVYNGDFLLLDSMMQPFSKGQISELYEKSLLITKEIDLDERVLGPLVALAPERITVYTEHFDHALLHTIQNIFEEKMSLQHLSCLPKKKKRINLRKKS
ncbi:sporulation protein YtxC [Fictibacillus iocasae]|uniref:Sporulation protein YtxC n=1 Tax=Fictibacillus iocasae TaxID=2715437 RepID=A0ABW2NPV5_9BACL